MYTYGWFHVFIWQKATKFCKAIVRKFKKKKKHGKSVSFSHSRVFFFWERYYDTVYISYTLYNNLRTLKCEKYVFGSWANNTYVYIFLIELKSYLLFSLHFFFLLSIYSLVLFFFPVLFLWLVYISFFLCNILYLTDLLSFKEDFFPLNVTNSAVSKCPFT